MGKPDLNKITEKAKKELSQEFYDFIFALDRKELKDFFDEFLTPSERIILARRLRVAKLLLQGHSQSKVRKKLGVGVTTVQFVYSWIEDEIKRRKRQGILEL